MVSPVKTEQGKDWVAIILALGLATAINCITFAVLWDALRSDTPGLSENATQILTTAFGGILGVVGSYIGYRAGTSHEIHAPTPTQPEEAPHDPAG